MGIWKARLIALLSMVAMLLALAAPVAMADEDLDCRKANKFEHRFDVNAVNCEGDVFVDRGDLDFVDADEFDGDDVFLLGDDFLDIDGDAAVEFEDLDCDGIPNHADWVDDQLCVAELEVFGEDVEVLVALEDVWDWWV